MPEKDPAFYFTHDCNAHDDDKMIKLEGQLGLEGCGIFWLLIETLRGKSPEFKYPLDTVESLAHRHHSSKEKFMAVILNYNLFEHDEEYFWSPSLCRRMGHREEIRLLKVAAGIKSGEARREKSATNTSSTGVEHPLNKTEQEKKRKEKKRKEKKSNNNLPDYLDVQLWNDFMEIREKKKAVQSDRAIRELLNDLERFRASGQDPNEIIRESVKNSWKGLFSLKGGVNGTNRQDIGQDTSGYTRSQNDDV